MSRLFKQFSFPGGIPSHVAPETPGSIHEGGEFGYSTARLASSATCELCKNSLTCTRRLQRAEKHRHRHKKSSLRGCQMEGFAESRREGADQSPRGKTDRKRHRTKSQLQISPEKWLGPCSSVCSAMTPAGWTRRLERYLSEGRSSIPLTLTFRQTETY